MAATFCILSLLFNYVADPPGVTTQPQDLKDTVPGSAVMFTVEATGTDPLRYLWQWKQAEEEGEWQPCNAVWSDGATLTIPSVQKCNEGSYHCVISNCAGSQTSNSAKLSVGKNPVYSMRCVSHLLPVSITACSRTAQHYHTSTRFKECYSREICQVYHPSHWNRTHEVSLAMEAS